MHVGNLKQAVVDGNVPEVRQILDKYPELVNREWEEDRPGNCGAWVSQTCDPYSLAFEHSRADVARCLKDEYAYCGKREHCSPDDMVRLGWVENAGDSHSVHICGHSPQFYTFFGSQVGCKTSNNSAVRAGFHSKCRNGI